MSGSPKAAEIRLLEPEERRLAEARASKAEEECRRREAASERARIALAEQLRASLAGESESLRSAVRALRAAAPDLSVPGGIPHLEAQIDNIVAFPRRDPASLGAAVSKIRALAAGVAAIGGRIASQEAAIAAETDTIRREIAAEAARLAAVAQSDEPSRQGIVAAVTAELQARLAGFEADEVTMAWCGDEVRAVTDALSALAAANEPDEAACALNARLDAALLTAQDRQLAEERRAHIVAALREGLREQGFQVGEASLVGGGFDSEVAFRAVRADRRWVDVSVPVEGHVFYDVDGAERVTERGADGAAYTRCDETELRLVALHTDLAERFGVATGELFWETKNPAREGQNANALPSGGPSSTRRRG